MPATPRSWRRGAWTARPPGRQHRRGELPAGEFVNESVISTRFTGRVRARTRVGDRGAIVPAITGRAWITGVHQLVVDPDDPFPEGFQLPDTWGPGARESLLGRPRN